MSEAGKEHKMVTALKALGVSFDPLQPEEHRYYKFKTSGLMPLVVEQWLQGGRHMLSVSHYGEQHGDLMADPDILYEVSQDQLYPVHFQNDYLGLYQQARRYESGKVYEDRGLARDLLDFTDIWADNISASYRADNLIERD